MPDVLSQNEVDALLNAVDTGAVDLAKAAEPAPKTSQDMDLELPENVVIYDFKRPERVSTDQIRSIEMMHESLARNLGATLSAFLRTIVG